MTNSAQTQTDTHSFRTAEYIPVTLWPHAWPTQSAWRALIFNAETRKSSAGDIKGNGLIEAKVIVRLNRRVLVSERRFYEWLERQSERG
jgi:hypothetical protein